MSAPYKEGFESHRKNKGAYKNPYSSGTNEYNEFERGWAQAMKSQPERDYTSGKYVPRTRKLETEKERKSRLFNKKLDDLFSTDKKND